MRKVIMGAAATAMLVGSTVAHAATPVANARTGASVTKSDALHGGELWLAILAAGLLAFVLFQINNDDNETLPHSP
jgi:hypothetical protein